MNIDEQVLQIRGLIASMSEEDQIRVKAIVATLHNVLEAGGEYAALALALVGAEQAAKS
jgi:hypothetical protein